MSRALTLLSCSLVVAGWLPAAACNFCSPMTGHTMLTDLDSANIAFIGELNVPTPVRSNPTAFDLLNQDRQKGEAGFLVRSLLRGAAAASPGEAVTVPLRVPGESGTLHLVTFDDSEQRWTTYRLSDDGLKFAKGAAAFPVLPMKNPPLNSSVDRLAFCSRFFATDDFLLREAVFTELAQAPFAATKRLQPRLNRKDVHLWLNKASRSAEQTRQLYLLLALCGDASDVIALEETFVRCVETKWAGTLDGVIVAYVTLGGTEALDLVDRKLLALPDGSLELRTAAANALKFLMTSENPVSRPRLMLSCRLLLRDPESAQLIAQDLAQWENGQWRMER